MPAHGIQHQEVSPAQIKNQQYTSHMHKSCFKLMSNGLEFSCFQGESRACFPTHCQGIPRIGQVVPRTVIGFREINDEFRELSRCFRELGGGVSSFREMSVDIRENEARFLVKCLCPGGGGGKNFS